MTSDLHIPPVFSDDFKQGIGNLTQGTHADRIHQLGKNIFIA